MDASDSYRDVLTGDPLLVSDTLNLRTLARELVLSRCPVHGQYQRVEERNAAALSYEQFFKEFMEPNKPVVIKGAMQHWGAFKDWVTPEGLPNVDALLVLAGDQCAVTVTDTSQQQDGPGPCQDTSLGEYIRWWKSRKHSTGHPAEDSSRRCVVAPDTSEATPCDRAMDCNVSASCQPLSPTGCWYLKVGHRQVDWHFVAACPHYQAYTCPHYFSSDWLNEHYDHLHAQNDSDQATGLGSTTQAPTDTSTACEQCGQPQQDSTQHDGFQKDSERCSDYRFVYLGPRGSWTPLHSDVLRSYSWSANIAGRKLWLLLPPEHTYMVYDVNMTSCAPHFGVDMWALLGQQQRPDEHGTKDDVASCSGSLTGIDRHRYPNLVQAQQHLYLFVQEPGEMLFVPSGWHHTVLNLTDTLSINHNWFNAHNIHWVWQLIKATHMKAQIAIADCRDSCSTHEEWWGLVERMVAADCGMNIQDIRQLLEGVVQRRQQQCDCITMHRRHGRDDTQGIPGSSHTVAKGDDVDHHLGSEPSTFSLHQDCKAALALLSDIEVFCCASDAREKYASLKVVDM